MAFTFRTKSNWNGIDELTPEFIIDVEDIEALQNLFLNNFAINDDLSFNGILFKNDSLEGSLKMQEIFDGGPVMFFVDVTTGFALTNTDGTHGMILMFANSEFSGGEMTVFEMLPATWAFDHPTPPALLLGVSDNQNKSASLILGGYTNPDGQAPYTVYPGVLEVDDYDSEDGTKYNIFYAENTGIRIGDDAQLIDVTVNGNIDIIANKIKSSTDSQFGWGASFIPSVDGWVFEGPMQTINTGVGALIFGGVVTGEGGKTGGAIALTGKDCTGMRASLTVEDNGNDAHNSVLILGDGSGFTGVIKIGDGAYTTEIMCGSPSETITVTLPSVTGTIALTSDIITSPTGTTNNTFIIDSGDSVNDFGGGALFGGTGAGRGLYLVDNADFMLTGNAGIIVVGSSEMGQFIFRSNVPVAYARLGYSDSVSNDNIYNVALWDVGGGTTKSVMSVTSNSNLILGDPSGSAYGVFSISGITGSRLYNLPNASGTLALTSDHKQGTAVLSGGTKVIDFTDLAMDDFADTNYRILLTPNANENVYYLNSSKATTGFTIMSSNGASTNSVDWIAIHD